MLYCILLTYFLQSKVRFYDFHGMGNSLESYRASIGLYNFREFLVRYSYAKSTISSAMVFALMLAFYTILMCLSFDVHVNPGPSPWNFTLAHLNVPEYSQRG